MGCQQSLILDGEQIETSNPSHNPEADYVPNRKERRKQIAEAIQRLEADEKALSRSQLGSFKDIQRRRLLNEVIHAYTGPNGEGFALVLDRMGTYLLDTQVDMTDIMYPSAGVCMIENLFKKRQPNPYMEAVYFIQPTANNLRAIVRDFESDKGPAMYSGVHILLTSRMPDAGLKLLRSSPRLCRHLISLKELHCDVFPVEDCVGCFGVPDSLNHIFGQDANTSNSQMRNDHYELIAERLFGVCVSLHEVPHVRIAIGNARSRYIYDLFASKITNFIQNNPSWWFHSSENGHNGIDQRATLIIVDRCDDLQAPLLHEFSYQAMCHDIFEKDIKAGLGQTSFEYSTVYQGERIEMSLSNPKDEIWRLYRHSHVVSLPQLLSEWYREFSQTEEFKLLDRMKSGGKNRPEKTRKLMKLLRTKDITGLKLKLYKQHHSVAQLLFNDLKSRNGVDELLLGLSELEAQIITGVEVSMDSGVPRAVSESKIRARLCSELHRPEVQSSDKLRLILLWFISFGGSTTQMQADEIFGACDPELPISMKRIIPKLAWLSVDINSSGQTKTKLKHRTAVRAKMTEEALKLEKVNTLRTRHLKTNLENTLTRHLDKTLDSVKEYEWHDPFGPPPPPPEFAMEDMDNTPAWYKEGKLQQKLNGKSKTAITSSSTNATSNTIEGGKSLRRHRLQMSIGGEDASGNGLRFGKGATLKFGGQKNLTRQHNRVESKNKNVSSITTTQSMNEGARTLVLMVGGATFGESKGVHQLMKERRQEMILLTTGFLTPLAFCDQLRRMGTDEDGSDEDDVLDDTTK